MRASCLRAAIPAALLAGLSTLPAWAQGAGVVTTLSGQATVARAALPAPAALKFKDDVFMRDRISTAENSLLRVLLRGQALVTVRELSVFTVTEEAGRGAVDLDSGKIAFGLVPQRLRPGQSYELRTPNAVAAVRGTVVVAEVARRSSQAGQAAVPVQTDLSVLSGFIDVFLRFVPGAPAIRLNAMETLSIVGNVLGQTRPLTPGDVARLMANLRPRPQHTATPEAARRAVKGRQQLEAASDVGTASGQLEREFTDTQSLQRTVPIIPRVDPARRQGY
jgi:hypothetical protein